jgi:hypothetical protein
MASNPTCVVLSSLKPLLFSSLKKRSWASRTTREHKTPESDKSVVRLHSASRRRGSGRCVVIERPRPWWRESPSTWPHLTDGTVPDPSQHRASMDSVWLGPGTGGASQLALYASPEWNPTGHPAHGDWTLPHSRCARAADDAPCAARSLLLSRERPCDGIVKTPLQHLITAAVLNRLRVGAW